MKLLIVDDSWGKANSVAAAFAATVAANIRVVDPFPRPPPPAAPPANLNLVPFVETDERKLRGKHRGQRAGAFGKSKS